MNGARKRSVAKVFRARNVQRKNNKQRSKLWKNNEKNYYFKKFFGFMLWSRCSNFMACILLFSAKFSVLFPKWISAIVVAKFSVRTVWYDGHSFDVGHTRKFTISFPSISSIENNIDQIVNWHENMENNLVKFI